MGCLSTCYEWLQYFNPWANSYESPEQSCCYCCGCCCCNGIPKTQWQSIPPHPNTASTAAQSVLNQGTGSSTGSESQPLCIKVFKPSPDLQAYQRRLSKLLNLDPPSSDVTPNSTNPSSGATPSPSFKGSNSRMPRSQSCSTLGPSSRSQQYNSLNNPNDEN